MVGELIKKERTRSLSCLLDGTRSNSIKNFTNRNCRENLQRPSLLSSRLMSSMSNWRSGSNVEVFYIDVAMVYNSEHLINTKVKTNIRERSRRESIFLLSTSQCMSNLTPVKMNHGIIISSLRQIYTVSRPLDSTCWITWFSIFSNPSTALPYCSNTPF